MDTSTTEAEINARSRERCLAMRVGLARDAIALIRAIMSQVAILDASAMDAETEVVDGTS